MNALFITLKQRVLTKTVVKQHKPKIQLQCIRYLMQKKMKPA